MRAESHQKRTLWRETVRVLAVMFLLLACVDLTFPQICGEDNEPLFPQRNAASTFGHADESGDPLPHPAPTEDCFCCCSHIVSEEGNGPLDELAQVSGSASVLPPAIPLAPVELLFHPPRLA